MPEVSVIMSVYNAEKFLDEAVKSILNQTFEDYEFIIINDCSTDSSLEKLSAYSDSRIKVVNNPENLGLTKSLNKGISLASGDFIARIDSDDISEPQRLETQLKFLKDNPDIDVVGSWIKYIDEQGNIIGSAKFSIDPDIIKTELAFGNVVVHPSTTIKTSTLRAVGGYDETFRYAQDYALWIKIIKASGKIANFPQELIKYRVCNDQITSSKRNEQHKCSTSITKIYLEYILGKSIDFENVFALREIFGNDSYTGKHGNINTLGLGKIIWDINMPKDSQKSKLYKQALLDVLIRGAGKFSSQHEIAMGLIWWAFKLNPLLVFNLNVLRLVVKCYYHLIHRGKRDVQVI